MLNRAIISTIAIYFILTGLPTWGQGSDAARFTAWDTNKDGKLSREELPKPLRGEFDRADTDKDRALSRAEDAAAVGLIRGPNRTATVPANVRKLGDIDYAGTGNPRQKLDLYLPAKRTDDKPLPMIVFIHGGAWRGGNKAGGASHVIPFVAGGRYAGVSIAYRLTGEARWPAQIHDCKAAIRWLKAHANEHGLDPARIAVWGTSAGGHLVAMLGVSGDDASMEGMIGGNTGESSKVRCVVDFFGPTELLTMEEQSGRAARNAADSPESILVGGAIQQHPAMAKNASPIDHVGAGDAPHLIVHGTADPIVPFAQSVNYKKRLVDAGVPAVLITVQDGRHGQGFGPAVNHIVADYLDQELLGMPHGMMDTTVQAGK